MLAKGRFRGKGQIITAAVDTAITEMFQRTEGNKRTRKRKKKQEKEELD